MSTNGELLPALRREPVLMPAVNEALTRIGGLGNNSRCECGPIAMT